MSEPQTSVTCKGCGMAVNIPIRVTGGRHSFDFREVREHFKAMGHKVDGTTPNDRKVGPTHEW